MNSYRYPTEKAVVGLNSKFPNPNRGYSVDGSMQGHHFIDFLPTNTIDSNGGVDELFVEFSIPPSRDFIDLSQLYLQVEVAVMKGDQGNIPCGDGDYYSLVNGTLNALWSSVEVLLNGTLVQERNDCYGIVSYLQTMLSMPDDVKATVGNMLGYYEKNTLSKDVVAKLKPGAGNAAPTDLPENTIMIMNAIRKSEPMQFFGPLLLDLSTLDSFLIDNVALQIRLHRQSNAYLINTDIASPQFRIALRQCKLWVKKFTPTTSAHLALNTAIEGGTPMSYMYKRLSVKTYNVQLSERSKTIEDPFQGCIPNLLIMAIQTQSAIHGDYAQDPHHLKALPISRIGVTVDGSTLYDVQMDYKKNRYVMPYMFTFINYGLDYATNGLSYKDFKDSKNVYVWDFSADDQATNNSNLTLDRHGILRLSVLFDEAITENCQIVLIGVSQAGLTITGDRRVLTSHIM